MDEDGVKLLGLGCLGVILVAICIGVFTIVGGACSYVGKVADVAQQEFDPHELFRRYVWFKDAAAVLEKKMADMKVYDKRLKGLEAAYAGQPRTKWARDDREQWSIWQSECAGIRASYNSLAAEYNSAMAKINWRFCEVGKLPPGATTPLPREFKPYVED